MDADVIVVGAGAAGLSAGKQLSDLGVRTIIVEARDRVGGRAWTSYDFAPHPVELGAEFIHGENVATWNWVRRFDLATFDSATDLGRTGRRPAAYAYRGGKLVRETDRSGSTQSLDAELTGLARRWAATRDGDIDMLSAALQTGEPLGDDPDDEEVALWSTPIATNFAVDADGLSTLGRLEETYEGDGERNFRIERGYSALWSDLARRLDIRLSSPVQRIRWGGDGVEVVTGGGTLTARHVIVAVPLAILKAGDITFEPELPEENRRAIEGLGAGHVDRVLFRFDEPFWPDDMAFLVTPLDSQVWWRPGFNRPDEAPVITAFFAGRAAVRIEQEPDDAAIAVLRDLERVFAMPLESRVVDARPVLWGIDPYAKMGYSFIPPGATGLRARLGQHAGGVLHFAGEATSVQRPATVHGAMESGRRAAREVIVSLSNR